jgi:hypothetical protein
MSLGRSSRFCSLGLAEVKFERVMSSCAFASSIIIHHSSMRCHQDPCIDVGKTLMNMEMLKFLKARSDTRLCPRHQLECAFHLPSYLITLASFKN